MNQPDPMANKRALLSFVLGVPLLLAGECFAWGLAGAAWHWMWAMWGR